MHNMIPLKGTAVSMNIYIMYIDVVHAYCIISSVSHGPGYYRIYHDHHKTKSKSKKKTKTKKRIFF